MPPGETKPRLPRNVVLLGVASLLNDVASEMLFPLLPAFLVGVLRGNAVHLGLIEGLGESASSLIKLWSGARSDSAGKRKGFVVFGYALAGAARPLIGLVAAPWQLVGLRLLDRVGKGVRTAPRDALIAESTAPGARGRAFGFHRAMDHLGAAIGPLLATGFLLAWPDNLRLFGLSELRVLFLLAIVPAVPIVVLLLIGLREPLNASARPPDSKPSLALRPLDARFRLYLATLLLFTFGNSSDSFLLLRAGDLGVPTAWLPILWCVFHLAKSGGSQLAGPWIDRLGARPLIWCGWLVFAATYLGFALATTAWHAWALFLVYAVYYALAEPAEKSLVADLVDARHRGLAYGWFNLTIGIGALPASFAFGVIYYYLGALAAFGLGAALALAAAVLLIGVRPAPEPAHAGGEPDAPH